MTGTGILRQKKNGCGHLAYPQTAASDLWVKAPAKALSALALLAVPFFFE
jgi:hypothetical protein